MYQMNYKTLEKLGEYLGKVQEKDITAEKRKKYTESVYEEIWHRLLKNAKGEELMCHIVLNREDDVIDGDLVDFSYLLSLLKETHLNVSINKVEKYKSEITELTYLSEVITIKTTLNNVKKVVLEQLKEAFQRKLTP